MKSLRRSRRCPVGRAEAEAPPVQSVDHARPPRPPPPAAVSGSRRRACAYNGPRQLWFVRMLHVAVLSRPTNGPRLLRTPRLLRAAVGFLSLDPRQPELRLLHRCFDTWRGIGDVVAGMARQEYDLELRRYKRTRKARELLCERVLVDHSLPLQ